MAKESRLDRGQAPLRAKPIPEWLRCQRDLAIRLLGVIGTENNLRELMREFTQLIHEWTRCDAVGIRLLLGEDYPYFETRGFENTFVLAENLLCSRDVNGEIVRDFQGNAVLECMCGNVLQGRFDPQKPFFTSSGSFWTNSTSKLLAETSEADRQARTRNRCNGEGYESVALIPLRSGGITWGLLQLNDRRCGQLTPELIDLLESLAAALAQTVARLMTTIPGPPSSQTCSQDIQSSARDREYVDEQRSVARAQQSNVLLSAIKDAQAVFIEEEDPSQFFRRMLETLVTATGSEFGFLDEVIHRPQSTPVKRSLAISNIAWNDPSRQLYEQLSAADFMFLNLANLAGAPVTSGQVVISNDPAHDIRSGGLPQGHPRIDCYMGIPLLCAGELVGVAGVANRPGGYHRDLAEFVEPLTTTCAGMIIAHRARQNALEARDALRRREAELSAICDHVPIMICMLDAQLRVLYANRALTEFTGKSADELRHRTACGIVGCINAMDHPLGCGHGLRCEQCSLRLAVRDSQQTGQSHRGVERRMTLTGPDGPRDVVLLASTALIPAAGSTLNLLVCLEDITQRKHDEARVESLSSQLSHASRLAMLGELAAGMAHEVNQPLCSIVNFAKACRNMAAREDPDWSEIRRWSDHIAAAATHTGDIVRQMLRFSRCNLPAREQVSLAQLIHDALLLLRSEARARGTAVRCSIPDPDLVVWADPVQIRQVLVNLMRNAIEASEEHTAAEPQVEVAVLNRSDAVQVSVVDRGRGVPEPHLPRVFDPFFSTKPHGVGLGLSISKTIIEDHGGKIWATPTSENGLTVHFTLPIPESTLPDGSDSNSICD